MKVRARNGASCRTLIAYALLIAYAGLAAGCTEFVTDSARSSIADFFTTVLSEAVDAAISPEN